MKRTISLVLTLALILGICAAAFPAAAEDRTPVGDWYAQKVLLNDEEYPAEEWDLAVSIHLDADGSASMKGSYEISGTWEQSGENISVTVYAETGPVTLDLVPGGENMESLMWNVEGYLFLLLTRDEPEAPVYGEPVSGSITLPAGLEFGMSVEEAVAVSGFDKNGTYGREIAMLKARGFDVDTYLSSYDVTIGGKKVIFYAYFTKNGLTQVEYIIESASVDGSRTTGIDPVCKESFEAVEASLTAKYGAPVNESQSKHQFKANFYDFSWNVNSEKWERSALGNDHCLTTRIVMPDKGGTVYIDDFCETYAWGKAKDWSGKTYTDRHVLTYTYYDFTVNTSERQLDVDF